MNTDCFACTGRGCGALEKCLCANDKPCPFYKTEEQLKAEKKKCYERISRITGLKYQIMNKYHLRGKDLV